jgi:sterol desaturase/sphingolipid hydroxylase (fatty acid hydroxylase superfamily)
MWRNTVDDLQFGSRDKRGDYKPAKYLEIAPFWAWPPQVGKVLKWIPAYLWPWNFFFMAVTLAYWYWVLPDVETMKTVSWGWALWLYYVKKTQASRFKYNHKFPSEQPSDVFWFNSQNIDNFLRSFLISVPLWTVCEVLMLWCFANGWVPWLSWTDNWLWLCALVLLTPAIHEVHFFVIHRLIHTPFLYKWVHSIHHNSVNPSPWSSLSMHPVEGFVYHAVVFWHLLIPSNPIVAMFQLHLAGYGAIKGHIGFDRLETGDDKAYPTEAYAHYLHHKYFDVNYGGDGLIPLDKWFGYWHDGSKEGDRLMSERFRKKRERANTRKQGASS